MGQTDSSGGDGVPRRDAETEGFERKTYRIRPKPRLISRTKKNLRIYQQPAPAFNFC